VRQCCQVYESLVFFNKCGRKFEKTTPPVPRIKRVNIVKILGVTQKTQKSRACFAAQTLHALQVLRRHGTDDAALQSVFCAIVVSKLQYSLSLFNLVCSKRRHEHITHVLRELHWACTRANHVQTMFASVPLIERNCAALLI
jgi:hypothetical protein